MGRSGFVFFGEGAPGVSHFVWLLNFSDGSVNLKLNDETLMNYSDYF